MLCQFLLYSKMNQLYIYLLFFRFYSHMGHFGDLSRVPCAIQQVFIKHLFYVQQYVYVNPNLPIYPSRLSSLVAISSNAFFTELVLGFLFCFFFLPPLAMEHGLQGSCAQQVQLPGRLNSCDTGPQLLCAVCDLPRSGMELVSSALVGRWILYL